MGCPALWIDAYAGMTVRGWLCWLVVCPAPHLWIADQVRNDGVVVPGCPRPVDTALKPV